MLKKSRVKSPYTVFSSHGSSDILLETTHIQLQNRSRSTAKMAISWPFSLLLLFLSLNLAKCELFTALTDLEHLIYRERELKSVLKNYIALEENRLAALKKFSERVENIHSLIVDNKVESFLGHPVNSYVLIKRFYQEWPFIEKAVVYDNSEDLIQVLEKHQEHFSTKEDLEGAITALLRLQDTYQLPPKLFADGKLPRVRQMPRMTVHDCYDVGRHAYLNNDMFYTKVWMEETLRKIRMDEELDGIVPFDVYDHLAYAEWQRGNLRKALNYTMAMVKIDPTHERAVDNVDFFGGEIKKTQITGSRGDTGVVPDKTPITRSFKTRKDREQFHQTKAFQDYEKLCRGKIRNLTKWEQSKMTCWHTSSHPLTILKPGRIERVFVKPEIFLIRDVISDSEIEHMKELAKPRLQRATIQHPVTGKLEYAKYRISKSGWITDEEDVTVRRISERVGAVTGLNMTTAEQLQVVNYGIGGHYEPHYDFAREEEDKFTSLGTGNRIATFLAYLSDVESGGGTVFTRVGTVIWPSKGDAAFWYNLKKSGDGDDSTRHAGCPVLVGSKW
ncbi:hypothetical protein QZH41_016282, partial [Actinostola sp. cb2023]